MGGCVSANKRKIKTDDFYDSRNRPISRAESPFSIHPLDCPFIGERLHERHPLDYAENLPSLSNSFEGNADNGSQDSMYTFDEVYDEVESYQTMSIDNRPPLPLPNDETITIGEPGSDNFNNSDYGKSMLPDVEIDENEDTMTNDIAEGTPQTNSTDRDVDINFEVPEPTFTEENTYEENAVDIHNTERCVVKERDRFSSADKFAQTQDRSYENQSILSSELQVPVSWSSDKTDVYDERLLNNDRNKYGASFLQEKTMHKELLYETDMKQQDNLPVMRMKMQNISKKPPFPPPKELKPKPKPDLPPRCYQTNSCQTFRTKPLPPEPLHKETTNEVSSDAAGIDKTSRMKRGYENVYDYVVGNTLVFCVKGNPSDKDSEFSQTHVPRLADRILEKRCLIESNIRVRHILGHLTFLDDTEEVRLKENESPKQAASLLIDNICKSKEEGKWMTFMRALKTEGYSYIVDVINGDSTVAEHDMLARKKLLQIFFPRLIEDLNPDDVIDHLYEKCVISSDDMDEIRREAVNKGRKAATYMLLDRIPLRSPGWYSEFLQSLRASDQGFLADEIEDTDRKTTLSCEGDQENHESITYQKYITPGYKTSSDSKTDEPTLCKDRPEVRLHNQLKEMQEKLKNKRKHIDILKQIKTVKLDLDSAQEEEDTLLKDIWCESNPECDNAANDDNLSQKENCICSKDRESAECEKTTLVVRNDELNNLLDQYDPSVALTILGNKETIKFNIPKYPISQELFSETPNQQLIKIYDATCVNNPGPCLPKPRLDSSSLDSGVFSAILGDIVMG